MATWALWSWTRRSANVNWMISDDGDGVAVTQTEDDRSGRDRESSVSGIDLS